MARAGSVGRRPGCPGIFPPRVPSFAAAAVSAPTSSASLASALRPRTLGRRRLVGVVSLPSVGFANQLGAAFAVGTPAVAFGLAAMPSGARGIAWPGLPDTGSPTNDITAGWSAFSDLDIGWSPCATTDGPNGRRRISSLCVWTGEAWTGLIRPSCTLVYFNFPRERAKGEIHWKNYMKSGFFVPCPASLWHLLHTGASSPASANHPDGYP